MTVSERAATRAEIQREALYREMDVMDFDERINTDSDPTMERLADSPREKQAYARIDADRKDLNQGTLIWVGGTILAVGLIFFGLLSEYTLVQFLGVGAAMFLVGIAALMGLSRRVFPAAEDLNTDAMQLGLLEAERFPETYVDGMWETVNLQEEDIKFWSVVSGVALLGWLLIIGLFVNGNMDIYVLNPDGIVAVVGVLLFIFSLYAIAGLFTGIERLERGARIWGRLEGQGKLLDKAQAMTHEIEEPIDEDQTISAFEEIVTEEVPKVEEPVEEDEPMYEDEPRPRVEYREPRPYAARPPVIQKNVPQQAQCPQAMCPQNRVQYVQVPTQVPYQMAPMAAAPTMSLTTMAQPTTSVPMMAIPQEHNSQLVLTTQQPYPQHDDRAQQEELYRALSYRLQDVHARLAWLRQRLEKMEEAPQPQAAAPGMAPAQPMGQPMGDSERDQLNMQIRRLETEAHSSREEQLRLVERIRSLQNEGLGSAALKADFEAAQREKERLLARQRRLEGEADKARTELDQTLNQMAERDQEHRTAIQRLLARMQDAETEKERLAMELEQMQNMQPAQPDFTGEQAQYERIIQEKEKAYIQAHEEGERLREQLKELSERQPEMTASPSEPTTEDMLATGQLERTGLDYQAYITLRDKFILDEVARLAASPLSRILTTRELDNTVVDILEEMELSFHTVTAVRKKKSQLKDFYRKPRIESMTATIDNLLCSIPGVVDNPSLRASLIEAGVGRPFYNSLIEHVILERSPSGTKLRIHRPSNNELRHVAQALELDNLVRHVKTNPLHMLTAQPNSEEDRFFDTIYLLPKDQKTQIKEVLLKAYIRSRQDAVLVSIKNLKLWYAGFYVEPERMAEVAHDRQMVEQGISRLPEKDVQTVTTLVGSTPGSESDK